LLEAYQMLDYDNKNSVSRESIMAVLLILNQDVPEIERLSKDERGIIFAFLDKDGSSSISLNEFLDFGTILLLQLTKQSDYATFLERTFPRVHESLCTVVRSTDFEHFIEICLIVNAVVIAFQDYPLLVGRDVTADPHFNDGYIDTVWEMMETAFTVLYVLEASLKVIVEGWKRYSESMRNIFDLFITVLAVLATAYVYCKFCMFCYNEVLIHIHTHLMWYLFILILQIQMRIAIAASSSLL